MPRDLEAEANRMSKEIVERAERYEKIFMRGTSLPTRAEDLAKREVLDEERRGLRDPSAYFAVDRRWERSLLIAAKMIVPPGWDYQIEQFVGGKDRPKIIFLEYRDPARG